MQTHIPRFTLSPGAYLHLDMEFHYPYLYQNLKLRVFDAPNMQKLLQDAVAQKLGIDDKHIKDWSGCSVDDEREYVVVTLKEIINGRD
jgi:Holliday junction resolvase RusA-like endonuclease